MSEATSLTRTTFAQVWIVALMVAFSVMSYFDRTIMSIAGPQIIREFGLSETQMGSIYSAFVASYALLMIPGGDLADRFGPYRLLTLVGWGTALFTGLTALCGRPGLGAYFGIIPAFFIMRLAFGAFTAPLYPSCGRINANWFPVGQRATVWGVVAAGAGVGGAVSPVIFPWAITHFGWRMSFLLAAVATGILAIVWQRGGRDYPREGSAGRVKGRHRGSRVVENPMRRTPWRRLLTNRNLLLLTLGYGTVSYFEYIFFFWIYYYFGQIRHMQENQTAIFTIAVFLSWTVMTPFAGWVCDRLSQRWGRATGRRTVAGVGLIGGAVCLASGVNLTNPLAMGTILALALGLAACSDGPFWASAIDAGGDEVGAACGIMNTGGNVGGAIAPVLTPFVATMVGWQGALYVGCAIALAGVSIWIFVDSRPNMADV